MVCKSWYLLCKIIYIGTGLLGCIKQSWRRHQEHVVLNFGYLGYGASGRQREDDISHCLLYFLVFELCDCIACSKHYIKFKSNWAVGG